MSRRVAAVAIPSLHGAARACAAALWLGSLGVLSCAEPAAPEDGSSAGRRVSPDPPGNGTSRPPALSFSDANGGLVPVPPGPTSGIWYLRTDTARLRLLLDCGNGPDRCTGSITDEADGSSDMVDSIAWSTDGATLAFRRQGAGYWSWFHARVAEGVLTGRFSEDPDRQDEPADPTAFASHVTGWKAEVFDHDLVPRVFDLSLDGDLHARLRLDQAPGGDGFAARFKIYASEGVRAHAEEDEHEARIAAWDGSRLRFTVTDPDWTRVFDATVDGRTLSGSWVQLGSNTVHSLAGTRAEVLSHGLAPVDPAARLAWQARTRRRLALLLMAGGPAPLSTAVQELNELASRPSEEPSEDRDDELPDDPARNYRLHELAFDFAIPDPVHAGGMLPRRAHGYLAVPIGAPPAAGGYPAVVALNGHDASGWATMDPDDAYYWYGDSFARHGFVVLAIDIGHRPVEDRGGLYPGVEDGDDLAGGNGTHPAIRPPDLDSDWEETGERAWDVMRAVDYLAARPDVDPARIAVAGLSLGGEMTTWAAALDTRVAAAVAAGFSPDLEVLDFHGSHPCWKWLYADIGEYIDTSDLHALIAPRALVVETGKLDWSYSWLAAPWAGDKQVLRRSRAAFADASGRILHYLHYDVHHFHVGGVPRSFGSESGVRLPTAIEPRQAGDLDWQRDGDTSDAGMTLFDWIRRAAP